MAPALSRAAQGRLVPGGRMSYVMDEGGIFGFFWLVLNWEWRQNLQKLAAIGQVLAI